MFSVVILDENIYVVVYVRRFDRILYRIKYSDEFLFGHLTRPISFQFFIGGMCMWLTDVHTKTCPLTLRYMRHIHACLGSTNMHTLQSPVVGEYRHDVREREDNARNKISFVTLLDYYVSC